MNKKLVVFLGIGCGGLLLLLVVAGIFVASSIPKMIEWGSEQIALEQERQQLANNWQPPKDNAPSEAFFPPQVDDYELVSHDQDAAIADLRFDLSGSHAIYESNGSRIDVYAYQVNELEKEALFKRVHDLHNKDYGTGVKRITTLDYRCYFSSPRHHQNHLWWMKDWLLVFRTRDAEDREPFVKSFLQAKPNGERGQ
jgi:hypothetical protein